MVDRERSSRNALAAAGNAADAFSVLADETRLAILVALWEEFDPLADDSAVGFSELRRRVGAEDSGGFNYHLDRLEGHFVRSVDDGYELTDAGRSLVQTVIAGAGLEAPSSEPAPVDTECSLCGAPVEVSYDDGWLYVECTECDGLWTDDGRSSGHLAKFSLEPAGLTDRSPEEQYVAAWTQSFQHIYSMVEGVCPTCSGPVDRSLDCCPDHADEGICEHCGRHAEAVAQFRCTVCKEWAQSTLGVVARHHPAVVAFCYEHDLLVQYGANDIEYVAEHLERSGSSLTVLSVDPPRVRVRVEMDGDAVALEFDETLEATVVE